MNLMRTFLKRGSICLMAMFAAAFAVADEKPVVLEVGDKAPVFDGNDEEGKKWKAGDVVGKKYLVVYFYPADFTTGCTRQAKVWRDNMNAVVAKDVEVVGVSGDSVRNHQLFKKAWKLNYTLLADEDGSIAKKFGVPIRRGGRVRPRGPDRKPLTDDDGKPLRLERKATFARWTFVIGKDGNILYKNMRVRPAKDSKQVLEFIEKLKTPEKSKKTAAANDDALSEIRKLGAQITYDERKPGRPVVELRIPACRGRDDHLAHLKGLGKLNKLHIGGNRVTDDGLKHLAGLANLETLIVEGASVKGSGLMHVMYLQKISILDLRDSKVSDAGLAALKLFPKLRTLDLSGTSVTDAGLSQLKKLKQLESLNLEFTERELTDKGIEQLKGLTRLKTLNLSFSTLTDAGLRHLPQLKNLENLIIEGTNVTDKGVAELHRAIPNIKITR